MQWNFLAAAQMVELFLHEGSISGRLAFQLLAPVAAQHRGAGMGIRDLSQNCLSPCGTEM